MAPFRVLAPLVSLALLACCSGSVTAHAQDNGAITRGAYLALAADCAACHTDKKAGGAPLAGGPPLTTPFGTFYGPNITPDKTTGIGNWTEDQFRRALREGINEHGAYMFPVFPFTSFTNLTDRDASDLYAYLMSVPPVTHRAPHNDVKFPFGWRPLLAGWRTLFFKEGPLQPVAGQSDEWNRGRYLAEAVGHCEECHTPRNFLGALDRAHAFAGNPHGPNGNEAPDITADKKDGIGDWKLDDIEEVLKSGMTPDGDSVGEGMADVVDGTSKLTDADRHALAIYIQSLPALPKTPK
jgi:mono/diheme cytochrome c family protein